MLRSHARRSTHPAHEVTFTADDRAYVLAIVRRIVDDADAQDVAQEALLLAFRRRDQYRADARYHTWLYRIAVTTAISHVRSRKRRAAQPLDATPEPASDEPSAGDRLVLHQEAGRVRAAFAALPASYREVLARRIDDAADRTIARDLGISMTSVKVRAFRGRQKLRELLAA